MTLILYPFMWLSAFGLVLSIACHLAALAGLAIPGGDFVWGLHIGIFVVWLPTVLVAKRMTWGQRKRGDYWKTALAGCPAWVRYALYGLFAYALLNFIYAMTLMPNQQSAQSPSLHQELRLFSGHWMVFYATACATLYSAIKVPGLLKKRRCAQGHETGPLDNFCPVCGVALAP